MSDFKEEFTMDQRYTEAHRILEKYPDRIPVICEKHPESTMDIIDKNKFLVPGTLTVSQFSYVVRKRIKLRPEQAIFIMCNDSMLTSTSTMREIYDEYKSECGFMYFLYQSESVFGCDFL